MRLKAVHDTSRANMHARIRIMLAPWDTRIICARDSCCPMSMRRAHCRVSMKIRSGKPLPRAGDALRRAQDSTSGATAPSPPCPVMPARTANA
jgi:hypothetical protein